MSKSIILQRNRYFFEHFRLEEIDVLFGDERTRYIGYVNDGFELYTGIVIYHRPVKHATGCGWSDVRGSSYEIIEKLRQDTTYQEYGEPPMLMARSTGVGVPSRIWDLIKH